MGAEPHDTITSHQALPPKGSTTSTWPHWGLSLQHMNPWETNHFQTIAGGKATARISSFGAKSIFVQQTLAFLARLGPKAGAGQGQLDQDVKLKETLGLNLPLYGPDVPWAGPVSHGPGL
jgi:hypothetical protein